MKRESYNQILDVNNFVSTRSLTHSHNSTAHTKYLFSQNSLNVSSILEFNPTTEGPLSLVSPHIVNENFFYGTREVHMR